MVKHSHRPLLLVAGLAALLFVPGPAAPQQQVVRVAPPRGEPVAETRLLMQGIAMPNFHGLDSLLQRKTLDTEGWTFARGQALLIAETGNLLLLRPPRGQGRDSWFNQAVALRESGTRLARSAANKDLGSARTAFAGVAGVCNRCHQAFQVKVQLGGSENNSSPPVP